MLYFAYGSNLNHKQIKERCLDSKFMMPALLEDFKFVYEGYAKKWDGSVANIIKSPGDVVWGGVYDISQNDLDALDFHEGYPGYYGRNNFKIKNNEGKVIEAIVYFKKNQEKIDLPSTSTEKQWFKEPKTAVCRRHILKIFYFDYILV
tara:strand:- start:11828 stop:12271 length:444 start_codon:yes stop_codon:yes gene_type:complete